ncbi:MAG TPA: hypothetical protein VF474_16600 [Phenylobacterium sp.]
MLAILIFWGLTLFTLGACVFAFTMGGSAERYAAGVIILNMALGYGVRATFPEAASSFKLVNDGLAASALLVLAVRYAAPWLGGAMLFYAAQFALHSYFLVLNLPASASRAHINNLNFAGITCCLVAGTVVTWRRRARAGRASAATAVALSPAPHPPGPAPAP